MSMDALLHPDSQESWQKPAQLQWLHPDLLPYREVINQAAEMASDEGPATARRYEGWRIFHDTHVKKWAPGVYSAPYLHPGLCQELRQYMASLGHIGNPEEAPEARINECVLNERDLFLLAQLQGLWLIVQPALAQLLLQMEVRHCDYIQGAVYAPDGTSETAWHQDIDSEYTAVVALSDPSTFAGGGTDVWRDGDHFTVPPLPVGHAMIFAGRTTLHKGNNVTKGQRHLLVHWCNQILTLPTMH